MMSSPPKKRLRRRESASVDKPPIKPEENVDDGMKDIGHCPNCQVPLSALGCQTPSWHLSECLETNRRDQFECSMGKDCDSTIVSHYMKCTHYQLAACRSGVDVRSVDIRRPTIQVQRPRSSGSSPNKCAAKQAKITSFFTLTNTEPKAQVMTRKSTSPIKVIQRPTSAAASRIDEVGSRLSCPKYKKLVDVPFVVDAFRYGDIPNITAYFLSHFHSDHYTGLTNKFRKKLFCSQVTANLVKLQFGGIPVNCIYPLPSDEPCLVNGVEVTLIEANHCPGAVMFLFRYTDGRTVLHTGDFRADVAMEQHPALRSLFTVDYLYLDTTYCQPLYDFPTQCEVLDFVVNASKKHMANEAAGTLIVCGSYTIGKEKVFTAIAQALKLKVWVSQSKRRILKCLDDKDLDNMIADDNGQATIHVLAMGQLNFQYLDEYLLKSSKRFNCVLAFRPTGWEHHRSAGGIRKTEFAPKRRGKITIYGVPYSEHSSFTELRRFVQFVKPVTVIPTVNVTGDKSRQQMDIIRSWMRKTPFDLFKDSKC